MDKIKELSPKIKKLERKIISEKLKFEKIYRNESVFNSYFSNHKKISKSFQLNIISECKNLGLSFYTSDYSNNLMIHDKINNNQYVNFLFIKQFINLEFKSINNKEEKKIPFIRKVFSNYNQPGFFSVLEGEVMRDFTKVILR